MQDNQEMDRVQWRVSDYRLFDLFRDAQPKQTPPAKPGGPKKGQKYNASQIHDARGR